MTPFVKPSLLFVLTVLLAGTLAVAEVIELEGVLKAVDVQKRVVTLQRTTAKGERADVLDVVHSAGRLDEEQCGIPVLVSYDTTLEVVTRLRPFLHKRVLDADTVESVSPEEARYLLPFRASWGLLWLPRLKVLAEGVVKEWAEGRQRTVRYTVNLCKPKEVRPGVTVMVCEPEERTATFVMQLALPGITILSEPVACDLAAFKGPLALDGLESLNTDVATALADHDDELSLGGLKKLDIDVAAAIARHKGRLSLDGLAEISDEVAEALATHEGSISLKGVARISEKARSMLKDKATFASDASGKQAPVTR